MTLTLKRDKTVLHKPKSLNNVRSNRNLWVISMCSLAKYIKSAVQTIIVSQFRLWIIYEINAYKIRRWICITLYKWDFGRKCIGRPKVARKASFYKTYTRSERFRMIVPISQYRILRGWHSGYGCASCTTTPYLTEYIFQKVGRVYSLWEMFQAVPVPHAIVISAREMVASLSCTTVSRSDTCRLSAFFRIYSVVSGTDLRGPSFFCACVIHRRMHLRD